MELRRAASFLISTGLLELAIRLPGNHRIIGASWDFVSNSVLFYVEGPDLPEVPPGEITKLIFPSITRNIAIDGKENYIWDWKIEVKN